MGSLIKELLRLPLDVRFVPKADIRSLQFTLGIS